MLSAIQDTVLLDREDELATVEALLERAAAGDGQLLLIEGLAGIGKTRLLREARARAEASGLDVLAARGSELERDFAFGVARQLFEPLLAGMTDADRQQVMAGAAAFSSPLFAGPAEHATTSADPSYAFLHGLYWLTVNLAEQRPIMIAVDDAHWADKPSLRFLLFLAPRLEGLPVFVALGARPGEPLADPGPVGELRRDSVTWLLRPGPLSVESVSRLIAARLGDDASEALGPACLEATGGNPFLIHELLGELARRGAGTLPIRPEDVLQLGPERVAESVLTRAGRIGACALALARAVAILGDGVEVQAAAALAGVAPDEAARAADALAEAAVLSPGRPLRFLHPIIRAAAYEYMPRAARNEAHARAAAALARRGEEVDAIASHVLAASPGQVGDAVERLREAASAALRRGSPEVAARYLARALEEDVPAPERALVLTELGSAEARTGAPGCEEHLAAATRSAADAATRVWAAVELGQVLAYKGAVEAAARVALEALDVAGERRELARPVEGLLLVFAETDLGARRLTSEIRARAVAVVERRGDSPPRGLAAMVALDLALSGGAGAEAARLADLALADGRLLEEQIPEAPHTCFAASALALGDRGDAAERYLTLAIEQAVRRGSARGFGLHSAMRAWVRHRAGNLDGAEADARACLDLGAEAGWDLFRALALSPLVDVLVERGDSDGASAALSLQAEGPQAPESLPAQPLRESRARLLIAQGRPREALVELASSERWAHAWGDCHGVWVPWRSMAALANMAVGERDEALRLSQDAVAAARRFGGNRSLGIALSAAGLAEGGRRGLDLLREAVEVLETSSARLEHARALIRLGALLRRTGQRTEAREHLRLGLDRAHRCGAGALVAEAQQELQLAGGRPRRLRVSGADALTASERRVAMMAADGLSNPQIAQALFLSRSTIEAHLRSVYRKLGIGSREELPGALSMAQTGHAAA